MQGAVQSRVIRFDDLEQQLTEADSRDALFRRPAFAAALAARLDEGLAAPGAILSLDVFDTLLLRDNSAEISRFLEVGGLMAEIVSASLAGTGKTAARKRQGEPPVSRQVAPVDAFLARHLGTKASYRASAPVDGCREGSLIEIHRLASRLLGGTRSFAEAFMAAELVNEARHLKLNACLAGYVKAHKARGGRIALITDMYLHAPQVAALLNGAGFDMKLADLLLSSADTKVSKASGGIFVIAETRLGGSPSDFFHVGDSYVGDYLRPRQRGWRALHLPLAEKDVARRRLDHERTAAILAGAHQVHVDIAVPH